MDNTLHILLAEEDAEAERVAELTGYLREELLELDVDDVTTLPGGEVPPGARAVDVTQIGALLVTLGSSATALSQVMTVIRSWMGRRHDTHQSMRLQMGDDVLELSEATDDQVAEAFKIFVQRHSPAGADQ
ncbi:MULTISPECIES: hypothetical protein [Streptomyces]|uniref:Uncharacterized protein n=1 Tax=Streptomyces koelreuteriae TaxID=2838015 RepID=A0ABX8FWY5_9ACTN|nr:MULTISPECIES: hypothetical protein [Streptomyces]QWB25744.1 hypothetical protein KJK29_26030 [Streptomyces koelreuteriae]UUA08803.1 hypothetical protein NNW98_26190 [Streptomyces koelreuteriae]UUA16408.1 hypothetical protein NNW99_26075 [Streptomyces sp. CRCS-T-1]